MKNRMLAAVLILTFLLASCSLTVQKDGPADDKTDSEERELSEVSQNSEEEARSQASENREGSSVTENFEGQNSTCQKKELLTLQNMRELLLQQTRPQWVSDQAEPTVEIVDIAYTVLTEKEEKPYTDEPELQVFADYAETAFGLKLDGSWKVFVHYTNEEQTTGLVQFQYAIGRGECEIRTNKSILFNLNDGKADMVFCSCLNEKADEEAIQERVRLFNEKYEQEQYVLQTGEKLTSEQRSFLYHYDTGNLVYSYAVFFSCNSGLINNDYGTLCLISEGGSAEQFGSDKAQ